MYYVHTDHLGSLNVLTDANGAIAQETSYDAWGNRRDPATLQNLATPPSNLITDCGFTGHEHLDAFKLINMNGRVYDPVLGRFLSPDNYVQDAGSTQDYNRYSYCGNSPLMFTDPSGFIKYQTPLPCISLGMDDGINNGSHGDDAVYNGIVDHIFNPIPGSEGYRYINGQYIDVATGGYADAETANNWMRNGAYLGTVSPKYYDNILHANEILTGASDGSVLVRKVKGAWCKWVDPGYMPVYWVLESNVVELVNNNFTASNTSIDSNPASQGGNGGLLGDGASFGAAVAGSMTTMVQGSAELTQADALAKINRVNRVIASEKAAFKTMGKVVSGAKILGSALGVVSLADHSTKAWNSFANGDYVNGWINVGKVGLDGVLMFLKSNPIVLTISVGYGIADAAGYLDYKP